MVNDSTTWRNSIAKGILQEGLNDGTIPIDSNVMSALEVYSLRPEFQVFPYSQFRDRLRDMRKRTKGSKETSVADSAALAHDRVNHPIRERNERGEMRWEGSQAELFLHRDMELISNHTMRPIILWRSRAAI
jgi:hypothetical protein